MDIARYLIIFLSPVVFLLTLLSYRGHIYNNLKKNHSKSFIKKHKGNTIQNLFYLKFKHEINKIQYIINLFLLCMFMLSVLLCIVYAFALIFGFAFNLILITKLLICVIIITMILRTILQIYDRFL